MRSFLFKRIRKPALVVGLGVVLYLAATIAAVVVVSALAPWWNVRGIKVKRRAPTLATAGEPFEYSLEVRSRACLARHLLELEDRFAGDEVRAVVVRVERMRPETVGYTLENPRRGAICSHLGEIYLYARFRNAVPAAMVEEFDRLEYEAFRAVERLKEASKVRS